MYKIIKKLYTKNKKSAFSEIINRYESNNLCSVSFLYFSNIVNHKLLTIYGEKINIDKQNQTYIKLYPHSKNLMQNDISQKKPLDYENSLSNVDFLFPDGIALQILYFVLRLRKFIFRNSNNIKFPFFLPNLNWTDFVPYFLEEIRHKFGNAKPCILLYWASTAVVEKTKKFFSYKWFNVIYSQDGFREFNRKKAEEKISEYQETINVLLIARTTSQIPIQELWQDNRKNKLKHNKIISFTVWGLFDFLTWTEKRAPKIIRTIKLERLWRAIIYPQKNYQKTKKSLNIFRYFFYYLLLKKR